LVGLSTKHLLSCEGLLGAHSSRLSRCILSNLTTLLRHLTCEHTGILAYATLAALEGCLLRHILACGLVKHVLGWVGSTALGLGLEHLEELLLGSESLCSTRLQSVYKALLLSYHVTSGIESGVNTVLIHSLGFEVGGHA
jgi:hypothetical protein